MTPITKGIIQGNCFYAPTSWKRYHRTAVPCGIVIHYTAVTATQGWIQRNTERLFGVKKPEEAVVKLLARAKKGVEGRGRVGGDWKEALVEKVRTLGKMPFSVYLTLLNAAKKRKASWCLCLDKEGLITQYSPDMNMFGTWHAGVNERKWREKYRGRIVRAYEQQIRWDGKEFLFPQVGSTIIVSPNRHMIGIECECKGKNDTLTNMQWANLVELCFTLCWTYGIKPKDIFRHRDFTPTKPDPEPPISVGVLRQRVHEELEKCLTAEGIRD